VPKEGFWTIGGYKISFRRDGCWYADEELIANRRIARLFSRHLCDDGHGGWVIDVGIDRHPVTVEDTPLVVTRVDGDAVSGFTIRTNDDESEPLDCASLEVGEGNVLYCTVDRGVRGHMRARFLRRSYYALARHIQVEHGRPVLHCRGRSFPIGGGITIH